MERLSASPRVSRAARLLSCCASAVLALSFAARGAGAEAEGARERTEPPKILAGYFEEWSVYGAKYNVANLQANGVAGRLSHLMYAFANVSAPADAATDATRAATCQIADPWAAYESPDVPSVSGAAYNGPVYGNFGALEQLKRLHPNLKILISIGGASAANTAALSEAASSAELRSQLAASCIDTFIRGRIAPGISTGDLFDGIDIDWEFPGAGDKRNFTLLLREFRMQLDALGEQNGRHYLLTMAAPGMAQNYSNIDLRRVAELADFLNVETYDYHGPSDETTNFAAPLFDSRRNPAHASNLYVEYTVEAYLDAGVPPRKIVLGVPFYGHGWTRVADEHRGEYQSSAMPAPSPDGDVLKTSGTATYATIAKLTGFTRSFDPETLAPSIYDAESGTFWSYDDPISVAIKMAYVMKRVPEGLGGAFCRALKDDDANGTLAKAMAASLDRR
ncbi:MAG TPA: glycoside hydrolase family 18 protein [Candidatus Limnocylindrales bacterium]|nr:glycoside hydrolase family 18 protein [Candidatus Limnocylindrales bacterium]